MILLTAVLPCLLFPPALAATPLPADPVKGCHGATFPARGGDPGALGPSPVGYRRFSYENISTAVWYPAVIGSEEDKGEYELDITQYLPPTEQPKIKHRLAPIATKTGFYLDLPLDEDHGPYPVIVFVHGTAAWKECSLEIMRHWASRGFVVVAQDHKGLYLADELLAVPVLCPGNPSGVVDLSGDTDVLLKGLAEAHLHTQWQFLQNHVDIDRVGLAGHSAGASVAGYSDKPGVKAIISMAGGHAMVKRNNVTNLLFLAADDDAVVERERSKDAYDASPTPKRFVSIEKAGHLAFTDVCDITNTAGQGILKIAQESGVCATAFANKLFDCNHPQPDKNAWDFIDYVSSAIFEESLQCRPIDGVMQNLKSRFLFVTEYVEDL